MVPGIMWFGMAKKKVKCYSCKQSSQDLVLFFKHNEEGHQMNLLDPHVDDLLYVRGTGFKICVIKEMQRVFEMDLIEDEMYWLQYRSETGLYGGWTESICQRSDY